MRGRKTAFTIELSPSERADLEHWLRMTTFPAGLARRARLILLLADGETLTAAACLAGLTVRNARKWALRYVGQRKAGLGDKSGRGRKPFFRAPGGVAPGQAGL
jgi:hypothetical protein